MKTTGRLIALAALTAIFACASPQSSKQSPEKERSPNATSLEKSDKMPVFVKSVYDRR